MNDEMNKPEPTTENPSVLPTDDEIESYSNQIGKDDTAFQYSPDYYSGLSNGAEWMRSKAEPLIATQQSEIERLKAELEEVRHSRVIHDKLALLFNHIQHEFPHDEIASNMVEEIITLYQSQKQKT